MLSSIPGLIIHLIRSSGYVGIFILMTLESALIPIPSEVTMPFAGFLAHNGSVNLVLIILIGAFGNLVGSLIAYAIGFFLEENVILSLIEKYGKYILLRKHDYEKGVLWIKKYGVSVTFFSRLLPVVRTFVSLPAGLSEMNIWQFSIFTFLGSLIWSGVLAMFGFYLGNNWESIHPFFQRFQLIIIDLIVLGILFYLNKKLKIIKFK